MNLLKLINLDNGFIQIHPFRKMDLIRYNDIVNDLFEIFGDQNSLPFNQEKFVKDKEMISNQLIGVSYGYEQQIRYTHFLTLKKYNKIIGEIIILSPKSVDSSYKLKETWLLEYFLNKQLWNNGIMSDAIGAIISEMKSQSIIRIGALVDRNNSASIRVLEKVGFNKIKIFDFLKDYYEI